MKTIIAGSRTIEGERAVEMAVAASGFHVTSVLCGCARGVDAAGEAWAKRRHIPVEYFPANWETWGKSAGYRRNLQMGLRAEGLIAIWDQKSRGTQAMIEIATKLGLKVFVQYYRLEAPTAVEPIPLRTAELHEAERRQWPLLPDV